MNNVCEVVFHLDCIDTPGWNNGAYGCDTYKSKKWCEGGSAAPGSQWTLGKQFNYPEDNCCICGKRGPGKYCK